ncbi:MAG: hypothetical protein M1378_13450 [Bacteroidetes bacterium]|nr:hypothetical protein [Bacteroidota bacterium]
MKKLKLYGDNPETKHEGFIAEVYVSTDGGKVVVSSENPEVKREIEEAIAELVQKGGPVIKWCVEEEDADKTMIKRMGKHQMPKDADFLNALREEHSFWSRKFGGYEINELVSEVVE